MASSLHIVTGASRGLGAALVDQLLTSGAVVVGIARHADAALAAKAQTVGATLEQWTLDLADPVPAAERLAAWLGSLDAARFDEAVLVNNAGVITPPGPIDGCSAAELSAALRVGLEATVLLSAAFLRGTRAWPARKKVLNISSGLGRRPMAGSAPYCAAKAGMDLFSRALALDEAHRGEGGAKVVSLAPGVIDTGMQVQLRSADDAGFPERGNFVALSTQGKLASPQAAAAQVLGYLNRVDFGAKVIADVRDTD
jgi:NAD(P)-dependent dehydrogenase (short-subunit alcohol dehydrogenase family)